MYSWLEHCVELKDKSKAYENQSYNTFVNYVDGIFISGNEVSQWASSESLIEVLLKQIAFSKYKMFISTLCIDV